MRRSLATAAVIVMSGALASAASLGTYGDTTVVTGGTPSSTAWQLVSNPAGAGYSGVYWTAPAGFTASDLTTLAGDYEMTGGTFGGGAPRFSIVDTTSNPSNEAYVYWGAPAGGGAMTDPYAGTNAYNSTGNYADGSSDLRVQVNGFGGDSTGASYESWSDFVAHDGGVDIEYITVDLDGGFTAATAQTMLLKDVNINGTTFTPGAMTPLPASAWSGLILLGGLATFGGVKRLRKQMA